MDRNTGAEPRSARRPEPTGTLPDAPGAVPVPGQLRPVPASARPNPAPAQPNPAPARPGPPPDRPGQAVETAPRPAGHGSHAASSVPPSGYGPRATISDLAADPRMPGWRRRAVIAGVLGAAMTAWQGWRLGLTVAAVAAIADTLLSARTTSMIPAVVRMSSAQRRTRRRLLLARVSGYLAVHSLPIPGTDDIVHHLVVGPGGVFAVDSQHWDRRLPVRTVVSNSQAGPVLYHGPFSQKDHLAHARWVAAEASRLLSDDLREEITVQPALVIYGPSVPWTVTTLRGVDVFGGRSLGRYFRSRRRATTNDSLSWEEAGEIFAAAGRALPGPARRSRTLRTSLGEFSRSSRRHGAPAGCDWLCISRA